MRDVCFYQGVMRWSEYNTTSNDTNFTRSWVCFVRLINTLNEAGIKVVSHSHEMSLDQYAKDFFDMLMHEHLAEKVYIWEFDGSVHGVCTHVTAGCTTPEWECWDRHTVYFWVSDSVSMAADASQRKALRYHQTLVWPNFFLFFCSFFNLLNTLIILTYTVVCCLLCCLVLTFFAVVWIVLFHCSEITAWHYIHKFGMAWHNSLAAMRPWLKTLTERKSLAQTGSTGDCV